MSCLALAELSPSDQVAVARACVGFTPRSTPDLLALLAPPAASRPRSLPPSPRRTAGGANPFPAAEDSAMVEKQYVNHPPLQVCYPGHRPNMWQACGNRATVYFVECSACSVRTRGFAEPDDAAHAWARRDVAPIHFTAAVA
ncbi:hypothetical protein RLIN73S_01514 [Rhodanobacter lindaniclasticus]